jgi:hypothetical protein
MPQFNDLGRSLAALDQDSAPIAVIEISLSSWLVAGIVPGIEHSSANWMNLRGVRQPLMNMKGSQSSNSPGSCSSWRAAVCLDAGVQIVPPC